jgi:predicted PurR-regulated permease PerM
MRYERYDWIALAAMAGLWLLALLFHASSALLAGLAGFTLMRWLCARSTIIKLPGGRFIVAILVAVAPFIIVKLISNVFGHNLSAIVDETAGLWNKLLDEALALRQELPETIKHWVPDAPDLLQTRIVELVSSRSAQLMEAGKVGFAILLHTIFGWLLGVAAAVSHPTETSGPLLRAWRRRWQGMATVFGRVARGQCWVALGNTGFMAIFLLVIAPFAGWNFPFRSALILITFVASLIPVAGNLVCNSLLLLVGVGVSLGAGIGALVFMVFVHKMEYLISARVVGNANHVAAWELIAAMLTGELLFGPIGLISTTVLYPYLKQELREAGWV